MTLPPSRSTFTSSNQLTTRITRCNIGYHINKDHGFNIADIFGYVNNTRQQTADAITKVKIAHIENVTLSVFY